MARFIGLPRAYDLISVALLLLVAVLACSSGGSRSNTADSTILANASGGAPQGVNVSGGASALASGGRPGSGGLGQAASGGNLPAGGTSGGIASSGGSVSSGGTASSGGTNSGGGPTQAAGGTAVIPVSGSKNWVFLMLGQSNMEGASPLGPEDQVAPARVFKLTKDKTWVPAAEGTCLWHESGLSPSRSFALKVLEKVTDPEVNIFIINAAVGGTAIEQWNPVNGEHYLGMLPYLEAGMQMGTVRGFLWHQGEANDGGDTNVYATHFRELIQAVRTKVGDPLLPVVAGQIGVGGEDNPVNTALAAVATTDAHMHVSSSVGLSLQDGDAVHYDTASERLVGERMATEWWSILGQ